MELDLDRVPRWAIGIGVAGVAAFGLAEGPLPAGVFALGALASYWNFRGLRRTTARIAELATGSDAKFSAAAMTLSVLFRFAVIGVGAFVILKTSRASLTAFLVGLFVSFAALLLEYIFSLIYART